MSAIQKSPEPSSHLLNDWRRLKASEQLPGTDPKGGHTRASGQHKTRIQNPGESVAPGSSQSLETKGLSDNGAPAGILHFCYSKIRDKALAFTPNHQPYNKA
jgi:hypothetical protein